MGSDSLQILLRGWVVSSDEASQLMRVSYVIWVKICWVRVWAEVDTLGSYVKEIWLYITRKCRGPPHPILIRLGLQIYGHFTQLVKRVFLKYFMCFTSIHFLLIPYDYLVMTVCNEVISYCQREGQWGREDCIYVTQDDSDLRKN